MCYCIPTHCRQDGNHVSINKKRQTMSLPSSLTPLPMSICMVEEGSASHRQGNWILIEFAVSKFVYARFSTEHKGHVPCKFSRFNLIWLIINIVLAKVSQEKRTTLQGIHILFKFHPCSLQSGVCYSLWAPEELHNPFGMESKFKIS